MSEKCPVIDRGPAIVDSLGDFRERTSQHLIYNPGYSKQTMRDASETVRGYYAPVIAANPKFGEYKVARALRSIAMSAAFFNGATFYMQHLGPELAAFNADRGEKPPFSLNDYYSPLPELNVFGFETPQCRQFVQELGSVFQGWGIVGILDPDEECKPLARVTKDLHKRFIGAELTWNENATTTEEIEPFVTLLAEDNAHGVLHPLIGLGGLMVNRAGINSIDFKMPADEMARDAIAEQLQLAGLTSISRSFAQAKVRPEKTDDFRATDVVAYEHALRTGLPMSQSSIATYFRYNEFWEVVSAHPSLEDGEWREPGMCAAFNKYHAANGQLQKGNEQFIAEAAALVQLEPPLDRLGRKIIRFSSGQVGINLGVITGLYTIYPDFPLVV